MSAPVAPHLHRLDQVDPRRSLSPFDRHRLAEQARLDHFVAVVEFIGDRGGIYDADTETRPEIVAAILACVMPADEPTRAEWSEAQRQARKGAESARSWLYAYEQAERCRLGGDGE